MLVGGVTAAGVDASHYLSQRLPLVIGLVVLLSFLLLMAVFRSIAVPIKAAIMNLLSIGAAYGVIVAVFQWGWAGSFFGVEQDRAHRPVDPAHDVHHPLRAVHGLRGVPAVADPGGVAAAGATTPPRSPTGWPARPG